MYDSRQGHRNRGKVPPPNVLPDEKGWDETVMQVDIQQLICVLQRPSFALLFNLQQLPLSK